MRRSTLEERLVLFVSYLGLSSLTFLLDCPQNSERTGANFATVSSRRRGDDRAVVSDKAQGDYRSNKDRYEERDDKYRRREDDRDRYGRDRHGYYRDRRSYRPTSRSRSRSPHVKDRYRAKERRERSVDDGYQDKRRRLD